MRPLTWLVTSWVAPRSTKPGNKVVPWWGYRTLFECLKSVGKFPRSQVEGETAAPPHQVVGSANSPTGRELFTHSYSVIYFENTFLTPWHGPLVIERDEECSHASLCTALSVIELSTVSGFRTMKFLVLTESNFISNDCHCASFLLIRFWKSAEEVFDRRNRSAYSFSNCFLNIFVDYWLFTTKFENVWYYFDPNDVQLNFPSWMIMDSSRN